MWIARAWWGARRRVGLAAASFALGVLVLAPGAQADDKVKVKGDIAVSAELNPDYRGRPSPVVLIMFQLRALDGFQNADFYSLYEPKPEVIAADVISRTQMTLQPGEARPFEGEFDEAARYIGVVAAFRDIENAEWRDVVELPQKGFFKKFFSKNKLKLQLEALAVSLSLE